MRAMMLLVGMMASSNALAATVEWNRTPIAMTLPVGVERQIRFDGPATVGLPADLIESGALRAEFANDTAYWFASEPFATRRFKVRLERTGEFVLFDVRAVAGGETAEPLEVRVARSGDRGGNHGAARADDPRADLVELVRFAARADLAPPRLVGGFADLTSVGAALHEVSALYRHADASRMHIAMVGQWSRRGLFVTVLETVNVSTERLDIDLRRLRAVPGPRMGTTEGFLAVAWTRSTLAPRGEAGSSARFYVVSREPFERVAEVP